MAGQVLQFVELSARDRVATDALPKLAKAEYVELRVHHRSGTDETVPLPPEAVTLLEDALDRLREGRSVALVERDSELSPNDIAAILGISRPLVVLRMDRGDLPFRYVGKHRRAKLKDVLLLKEHLDRQQAAMDALAADTEDLMTNHGL
jgi:hypothetical protein